ncbi:MAG: Putative threonine efflux protein [Desulfotomaculum sp. 46_296]|nr:MAG: Putative threonine efflux protein [Desulfotomaculum sp. 46_296]KUK84847.1 MAG: Putative threonine efflux protein [Desulfofundulus kuznetsovii]HAU31535.1 lysine transporter LysE [Desulfotomaculum sp.]
MKLLTIFLTTFLVSFSGAVSPGPLLSVTISESIKRGFRAGPLIVLGHAILEGALVIALIMGLASFLGSNAVQKVIAFAGSLILLCLGWLMLKNSRFVEEQLTNSIKGSSAKKQDEKQGKGRVFPPLFLKETYLFWEGIFTSVSNPYWTLWWATIGLGYITISLRQGMYGLACFFSGHILADLAWYSFIAAMISRGRKFFRPVIYRRVNEACGLFLIGLGLYFIYWGLYT